MSDKNYSGHFLPLLYLTFTLISYSLPDYCSRLPGAFLLKCQPLLYFFFWKETSCGSNIFFYAQFEVLCLKKIGKMGKIFNFWKCFYDRLRCFVFCILWSLIGDRDSFPEKVLTHNRSAVFAPREEEDPVSTVAIFLDINTFTSWHDRIITTCPIDNFSLKDSQGDCFVSSLRFIGKWQITGFCFRFATTTSTLFITAIHDVTHTGSFAWLRLFATKQFTETTSD